MTTRAEVRATIRRRLEDNSGTPLWDDALLNDLIADAIRTYGTRCPAQRSLSIAVPAGATSIPLAITPAPRRVVRVLDPNGAVVSRDDGVAVVSWRWWNGAIILGGPAIGGDWQIDYLAFRAIPDDDSDVLDVEPVDEENIVLLAAASALRRRVVEDGKRGIERGSDTLERSAERLEALAEERVRARFRVVRGGWLTE